MSMQNADMFIIFGTGVVLTLIVGFYCIIITRNLLRAVIGLQILTKSVTILLALAGHMTGRMSIAQSMIITLIVIEVAVIVVAVGLILNVHRKTDLIDASVLRDLKG